MKIIEFFPGWERMDQSRYAAIPFLAIFGYWFRVHFCKTWFFGYQFWKTYHLSPSHSVMLFVIPFLGIEFGVWRLR